MTIIKTMLKGIALLLLLPVVLIQYFKLQDGIETIAFVCYVILPTRYDRRCIMAVSYNKLWKLMIDKNISKTELIKAAGISTNVMAKMGKNEPVRLEALAKLCSYFQCQLDDIVEILPDEPVRKEE